MKKITRRQALAGVVGVAATAAVAKASPRKLRNALKELPDMSGRPAHLPRVLFKKPEKKNGICICGNVVCMCNAPHLTPRHVTNVCELFQGIPFVEESRTSGDHWSRERLAWLDLEDAVAAYSFFGPFWGEVQLQEHLWLSMDRERVSISIRFSPTDKSKILMAIRPETHPTDDICEHELAALKKHIQGVSS